MLRFALAVVLSTLSSIAFAEEPPVANAGPSAPASPAPLPLPSVGSKPMSLAPGQRQFRVPMAFPRVERFYRDRFAGASGVALSLSTHEGARTLTLTSRRPGDAWVSAVVREGAVGTTVEVTPVVRMAVETIQGRGLPVVQLVIPLDPGVRAQAASIDHMPGSPGMR